MSSSANADSKQQQQHPDNSNTMATISSSTDAAAAAAAAVVMPPLTTPTPATFSYPGSSYTAIKIPCCLCGTMIIPNNANQCGDCLAQEFHLQDILQRGPGGGDIIISQCRLCRRYKRTEKLHVDAEPESPELLSLCLKHIPALQASGGSSTATSTTSSSHNNQPRRLHLVDAGWIWTEPHSMRLRLKLTVRTEIQNVNVQQRCMVELVVKFKQCPDCNREYTNRTWHALVQLRQKRTADSPKKGLVALEMALARNRDIRKHVLRIDNAKNGFDFYFISHVHAQSFANYLQRVAPMRTKTTKKLVSADVKNNTANLKHTITCDLVPLCRDDLLLIHKSMSKGNRLVGRLALVLKVSSTIHLIDASPKRECLPESQMDLSPETYYKNEKHFSVIQASHRLVRFVVLDVELCEDDSHTYGDNNNTPAPLSYKGPASGVTKYALADVQVARESDFGVNDETYRCVTHLGHLINPGDVVLGYDLVSTWQHHGDWEVEKKFHSGYVVPDVVLVKKVSGSGGGGPGEEQDEKPTRSKKRERRRTRKEGKMMRELEASAARMGFLDEEEEDVEQAEEDFNVDANRGNMMNDGHDASILESELERDPELRAEVAALERELESVSESVPMTE